MEESKLEMWKVIIRKNELYRLTSCYSNDSTVMVNGEHQDLAASPALLAASLSVV